MSIHLFVFWLAILLGVSFFVFIPPIQQDVSYHQFIGDANHTHVYGNGNVWSNVGFLLVGVWGMIVYMNHLSTKNIFLLWVSLGLILTALGSAYYHIQPNNETLFWDRLPMAIVFSGFFAAAWQYYYPSKGLRSVGCLFVAVGSVVYWKVSLLLGFEDLRPYVMIQFLPIIILMIWSMIHPFNTRYQRIQISCLLIIYILAKISEHWDQEVDYLTHHLLSGHTIKHLLAALASYVMIRLIMDWSTSYKKATMI